MIFIYCMRSYHMMGWQQVFLAECFGTAILIFNVFATIDHPMPGRCNTDDRYEDEDEDEDDRYEDQDYEDKD